MNILTLFFSLGISMTAAVVGHTKSYERFCFQEHIQESISINKERKKVYSQMTNRRSDKIFNTLIAYEYFSLIPAALFDLKALTYQKKGMDLFCHEFMSMNHAPDFDPRKRIIPQEKFRPLDWKFYKDRLTDAFKYRDTNAVRRVAIEGLLELQSQPNYYCFSRHLLESIYRFAYFIPLRSQQAQELGLKAPTEIMFNIMKLHLLGLKEAHKIDLWSQPIQMSGIPILCTEVPDLLFDINHPELDALRHQ